MGYDVKMSKNGRLVIPKKVREAMGLGPGEHTLTLEVNDGRVVILTAFEKLKRFREILGPYLDKVTVDDFIAEKRAEAAREIAEIERDSRNAEG